MKIRWKTINRSNKVSRSRSGTFIMFLIMLGFASFMAFPMVVIIGNAFKPLDELWVFPPKILPGHPTLNNFRDMFNVLSNSWVPFLRYIYNSLFITTAGTIGHIIFASMCAYPLAKKRFPGRNIIFNLIVFSLMFNATVTTIPNYITMAKLGWVDTHLALIVPAFASSLGLYLMKQFIEQIPDSLIEAARIDGASQWYTFWYIVMPNVKSAWLTLMLLSVQGLWGIGSTRFIQTEELKTLPYALSQILAGGIARAGVGAAVTVFMMIVPISIFIVSQRNIIDTMSTSGMKD
ncbi:MAG: carbohydrate ABC transporter permease [Saccharofermentanales bacterium]